MNELYTYALMHTARGECQCGRCIDRGNKPDPGGHTVDVTFFKVARTPDADAAAFKALVEAEFPSLLDGQEHSYLEIGGMLGDQGAALQAMALGALLGVWQLLTPATFGFEGEQAMELAGRGMVTVRAPRPGRPQ